MLEWYIERLEWYVAWEDFEQYCGPGFAAGQWSVRLDALAADFKTAMRAVSQGRHAAMRAAESQAHPTLDDWLRAEARDELGAPAPIERAATELLPSAADRARASMLRRLHARVRSPACCRRCEKPFARDRHHKQVCQTCKAASIEAARQRLSEAASEGQ